MELGSVTLKRIGFFCFPIKHSTHTLEFKNKPEIVTNAPPMGCGSSVPLHPEQGDRAEKPAKYLPMEGGEGGGARAVEGEGLAQGGGCEKAQEATEAAGGEGGRGQEQGRGGSEDGRGLEEGGAVGKGDKAQGAGPHSKQMEAVAPAAAKNVPTATVGADCGVGSWACSWRPENKFEAQDFVIGLNLHVAVLAGIVRGLGLEGPNSDVSAALRGLDAAGVESLFQQHCVPGLLACFSNSVDELRAIGRENVAHATRYAHDPEGYAAMMGNIDDVECEKELEKAKDASQGVNISCVNGVDMGLKRMDVKFLHEIFDRHKDESSRGCGLSAAKISQALSDADAPLIPDSEEAVAALMSRYDGDVNRIIDFNEFRIWVAAPDELHLWCQEKKMPLMADALRPLVGRGSDQLQRVSRLSEEDMRSAWSATGARMPDHAEAMFTLLKQQFETQFVLQTHFGGGGGGSPGKFTVQKMACGTID
jgi:hypothetical protein